jgi:Flp pilus assembly protein TadG
MKTINRYYYKGQVAVMVALSLVVLVGMVGLAIDSGMGYGVKAKLNSALDAASIAGARALSLGATQAEQRDAATMAAKKFFHANYPAGYLGSTPTEPIVTVTFLPPPNCTPPRCGTIVDVTASADLPVTFMRVLNFNLLNVSATATSGRQTVDLAFVVDVTGSMSGVANSVKTRAQDFLNHLDTASDRVTLISYKYGATVSDAIRTSSRGFNRGTMQTHIQGFNFSGNTNFGEGFWQARNQLNSVPVSPPGNRSNLRIILFFTDGSPNTFASSFPVWMPDPAACKATNDSVHNCNCSSTNSNAGTCAVGGAACSCSTTTCTGSLVTGDATTGTPTGLFQHESTSGSTVSGVCNMGNQIISSGKTDPGVYKLPSWYDAPHTGANPQTPIPEFQITPEPPNPPQLRTIGNTPNNTNINLASRNLAEEMAWAAREEGIYVFVLGLGDLLHTSAGPQNEMGERLLMCMANTNKEENGNLTTPYSRCYTYNQSHNLNQPAGRQPVGTYCWAKDDASLKICYDKMASQILRLLSPPPPPPA